ncbi:aromatic ring-hydroxylating dioxygenase subunit alpha [Phormidium tenue FACHB-886]|nr:aromatic ring-hydroxylating dioxygenase subunit alpha [Phormidium tenue FACHB-886]
MVKPLGLPRSAYFQRAVFESELQTLWRQSWQMVGRESQAPQPGNYFTCVVEDQPLLVTRTEHGHLQGFHNVCPHRGAQLVAAAGACKQIVCPYHAWQFDLEGNLVNFPQKERFPDLDRHTVRLRPVRLETWGGFVFISLSDTGPSLKSYLAGFPDYLKQYEHPWESLDLVDAWSYEEAVNWKFLVENYLESYHLSTVHGQSLKCFDPRTIQTKATGAHYQICVSYKDQDSVRTHQVFAGEPQRQSYQGFIFPNWMINTAKDTVSVFRLMPLGSTQTRFEVWILQSKSQQENFPYNQDRFRTELDHVLQEDFGAVRRLQAGVQSEAYGVLQFASGLEDGIPHFHRVWDDAVNGAHSST